jgi:hypothetical protein
MPIPKSVRELIEKKSEKITHINLSNCGLNDNDMVELQELLEQNTYINSIDLSDNNIHRPFISTSIFKIILLT